MERRWKTALYCRYSNKEDGKAESSSIENQREMLHHFLEHNRELEFVREYADDDYTGTNFNRPGFQEMKRDCLSGKIDCILVKDHSRFARKSSKMQLMLEEELGNIRYISKDDHFDSRYDDYDVIFQMKNLFNEMYAQDISRKVHSSIDDKQRAGKFIGAFASYGYRKDPDNKNQLLIDEEAAQVVRQIYEMRLGGMNISAIARELNRKGVLTPYEYKLNKGFSFVSPNARRIGGRYLWDFSSVNRILRNRTYAGDLEQGRKRQKMRNKPKTKPKEEWVVARNCVPAIIPRHQFDQVQDLLDHAKHYGAKGGQEPHVFAGLLWCGECGKAMVRTGSKGGGEYYVCGTRKRNGKSVCDLEYVPCGILKERILDDVNEMIGNIENWGPLMAAESGQQKEKDRCSRQQAERKKEALIYKRRKYYRDYMEGILSREDYLYFKREADQEEEAEREKEEKEKAKIRSEEKTSGQIWREQLLERKKLEALDRETVQETVSRIRIFKGKRIEITYKFYDSLDRENHGPNACANQMPGTAVLTPERFMKEDRKRTMR